ncbi:tRNA (adenosine(37)-N6)-threonylcarbamoyltransferase complex transferase subunit TsaD [Candidatus Saccharibacteria bacterium]|nr:tRNA (adenosine(37)-N6)-threonylcarbamoyltransferase complex transferase subunit TsaD [Candidatus Saccharibacteria bacterium]
MKILGLESSCDETAAAVVENGTHVLSNVVASQIDIFAEYGGVIPEIAARSHLEAVLPVIDKALKDANETLDTIDAIAVTHTPGLLGSLLVGTLTARTLALLHEKPLYAVHHLKSHVYANWLYTKYDIKFPVLALVISGGHTQILSMPSHNSFEIIGTTKDDAIGECFDKVAKILGFPYPGGPEISKHAENGDPEKYPLPIPKVAGLDFSFSGLKTAVIRKAQSIANLPISYPSHDIKNHLTPEQKNDLAASFESTAVKILLEKLDAALPSCLYSSIIIAGGVSANSLLRKTLGKTYKNLPVYFPDPKFSGDNGAMVASAAFFEIESGVKPTNPYSLTISPRSAIS